MFKIFDFRDLFLNKINIFIYNFINQNANISANLTNNIKLIKVYIKNVDYNNKLNTRQSVPSDLIVIFIKP